MTTLDNYVNTIRQLEALKQEKRERRAETAKAIGKSLKTVHNYTLKPALNFVAWAVPATLRTGRDAIKATASATYKKANRAIENSVKAEELERLDPSAVYSPLEEPDYFPKPRKSSLKSTRVKRTFQHYVLNPILWAGHTASESFRKATHKAENVRKYEALKEMTTDLSERVGRKLTLEEALQVRQDIIDKATEQSNLRNAVSQAKALRVDLYNRARDLKTNYDPVKEQEFNDRVESYNGLLSAIKSKQEPLESWNYWEKP